MRKIKIFGVSVEGEDEDIVALLRVYNNVRVTTHASLEARPHYDKRPNKKFDKKFDAFWAELQAKGFVSFKRARTIFGRSFRSLNVMKSAANRGLLCTYEERQGFTKAATPAKAASTVRRCAEYRVEKQKHFDKYIKAAATIRKDGFVTCKDLMKVLENEAQRIGFSQYIRRHAKDVRKLPCYGYHLDGRKHDLIKAATPAPKPSTTAELLLKDINDTVKDKKTHEFLIAIKQCLLDKGRVTAMWRQIYCPRADDWQAVLHAIMMRSKGLEVAGHLTVDVGSNDLMLVR